MRGMAWQHGVAAHQTAPARQQNLRGSYQRKRATSASRHLRGTIDLAYSHHTACKHADSWWEAVPFRYGMMKARLVSDLRLVSE